MTDGKNKQTQRAGAADPPAIVKRSTKSLSKGRARQRVKDEARLASTREIRQNQRHLDGECACMCCDATSFDLFFYSM